MKSINNEKPNNPNECTPIQSDDIIIGNLPKVEHFLFDWSVLVSLWVLISHFHNS